MKESTFKNSTNLKAARWDSGNLEIDFHNGKSYRYLAVPEAIFTQLSQAESAGKFFISSIRDSFKSEKLEVGLKHE